MPRSNPHARERVMDDRKHLDAFASFVPFVGRETSGVSSAGSSRGSALQTPTRASVTKRCSRLRRVGALLVREDPRLGALGPCRRDKSFARTVRSSSARLALSDSSALRKGLRRTRTGATATARRSPGWRKSSGPAWRFVATGLYRAFARPAGVARNRPFEGSCSRSYRSGRNRTNGDVVVDARSSGRLRLRVEVKCSDGWLLWCEGSPGRWKALWIISTRIDRHGSMWAGGLGRALADTSSSQGTEGGLLR
jgi:hypothetical protein